MTTRLIRDVSERRYSCGLRGLSPTSGYLLITDGSTVDVLRFATQRFGTSERLPRVETTYLSKDSIRNHTKNVPESPDLFLVLL